MEKRSHVDMEKIKAIGTGEHFEYKDVVAHNLPKSQHPEDGALFNKEVESGVYAGIVILNEDLGKVRYKKV